jgi:hypothetical protein
MITWPVTADYGGTKNRPAVAGRPKSLIRALIQGSYKGLDTFFVDLDWKGFSSELRIFVLDLS